MNFISFQNFYPFNIFKTQLITCVSENIFSNTIQLLKKKQKKKNKNQINRLKLKSKNLTLCDLIQFVNFINQNN